MGSNAIQAKGGTQHIRIERNTLIDAGQRAVNLGGSTGLAFFRPQDAGFEAADLQVYANLFVRSVAPVAFVGCIRVDVANNTIVDPERWVFRILQETVDERRFALCGNNLFRNNIVVMQPSLSAHVNIGPNTDAASFSVNANLWYMASNEVRSRPTNVPWTETAGLYGVDPQFVTSQGYILQPTSPARQTGIVIDALQFDHAGKPFGRPPSRGALEVDNPTSVLSDTSCQVHVIERVSQHSIRIRLAHTRATYVHVFNVRGQLVSLYHVTEQEFIIPCRPDEFVVVL
jgi:hypothetical protein